MERKVSLAEIKTIAKLSKLSFSEQELANFSEDINSVISHFEKLNRLDLQGVSPTSHISWGQPPLNPDEAVVWENRDWVLEQAPEVCGRLIVVPKIVEK